MSTQRSQIWTNSMASASGFHTRGFCFFKNFWIYTDTYRYTQGGSEKKKKDTNTEPNVVVHTFNPAPFEVEAGWQRVKGYPPATECVWPRPAWTTSCDQSQKNKSAKPKQIYKGERESQWEQQKGMMGDSPVCFHMVEGLSLLFKVFLKVLTVQISPRTSDSQTNSFTLLILYSSTQQGVSW